MGRTAAAPTPVTVLFAANPHRYRPAWGPQEWRTTRLSKPPPAASARDRSGAVPVGVLATAYRAVRWKGHKCRVEAIVRNDRHGWIHTTGSYHLLRGD